MTNPPPGPTLGPCTAWIDADALAACCDGLADEDPDALAVFADEASSALYEISGRQFSGLCTATVRPCRDACSCWGASSGLPWYWALGSAAFPDGIGAGGWWANECGDRCGCGTLSELKLNGYPVRDITSVKIDGVELDPGGYRLDGWRWLVRLSDPGPPVVANQWPACQDMSLPDTEPGTFSITYRYGIDPPQIGRDAACQLACQLFTSVNGGTCALPAGVTRVVRQGVEIDRELLANWFDPKKPTGLVMLDTFLAAYWRVRAQRRAAVFSPDVRGFGRRMTP